MKSYRYKVVDVTTEALDGNALAVFPDASELDATTMQKIAKEFNLAEAAFVLPATPRIVRQLCGNLRRQTSCPLPGILQLGAPSIAAKGHCSEKQQRLRRGRET
jgi:hypothetical protein